MSEEVHGGAVGNGEKSGREELAAENERLKRELAELRLAKRDYSSLLIPLAVALSSEKNYRRLLERILVGAKDLCNADGGTLYILDGDGLKFEIVHNDTLRLAKGGVSDEEVLFPPVPLHDPQTGAPNHHNVATHAALTGKSINTPDAYAAAGFDFSGTRTFDHIYGYRSVSFLTVPLKNHFNEVIGVLQLINARAEFERVTPFEPELQRVVESLSALAAAALENSLLIQAQKDLFESFIRAICFAIDEKSPYTGGHCKRVPVLTEFIARAASEARTGPLADFRLSAGELEELSTAAWLHDIGKITTPEHIVDKATKLETIRDRIHELDLRFELLKREAELRCLRHGQEPGADARALERELAAERQALDADRDFIRRMNLGGESMAEEDMERVRAIAARAFHTPAGREEKLLTEDEVYNLCVARGTLTERDRRVIAHHVQVTLDLLGRLPFPKHLRRVPEYAGCHHEKLDGTGYPRGLTADRMPLPARIVAVADIFEALTAGDRPYKKAKTLSETLAIMKHMKRDRHIDRDFFDAFLLSGHWRAYAEKYLRPEQLDVEDVTPYLG